MNLDIKAIEQAAVEGYSLSSLSNKIGISHTTLTNHLKRNGYTDIHKKLKQNGLSIKINNMNLIMSGVKKK
jgi:DNA-binding transcriptional ArsR family regulator